MVSRHSRIAAMVECSLCVALALVMTMFDFFRMPQGGSLDFELVPLILFTYRRGWKWGIRAGILNGLMHFVIGRVEYKTFVQFILDYPLAYSFVGLVDLHPFWLGLVVAYVGQATSSIVAGRIFFAELAPAGQNPWVYSIFYNAPVLGAKYLVSGIATFILWKILQRELAL